MNEPRTISFAKMSGSGNDFVAFDNRRKRIKGDIGQFARWICARRIGVGADGVLLIEKDRECDFLMRYLNADGSEVEMCGNGGRCVAFFAYVKGIAGKEMRFRSSDGIHEARVLRNSVKLKMREPVKMDLEIPLLLSGRELSASFVNTGVPHVVVLVEDVEKVDVVELGREIRYLPRFQPGGTNADFAQVASGDVKVRTYERGVEDETLACGTGCVAAALVLNLKRGLSSPVSCLTAGGEVLTVRFKKRGNSFRDLFLEGGAAIIFEGKLPLANAFSGGNG
jgi:diaminopimelate epimerase